MQPGNKFHGLQYSVSSSLVIPVYVPSPQVQHKLLVNIIETVLPVSLGLQSIEEMRGEKGKGKI